MAIRQAESSSRLNGWLEGGIVAESGDAELLLRFTAERDEGAEAAFAALVRRHGPMVFRVCRQIVGNRHTAEDAFQATFLILARRAGSIRGPELLGHWLHGVAFRTAREARMRQYRRQRRECAIAGAGPVEPVDRSGRPDLELVCREEFEVLHEEVSRLPERYRVPLVLCDLEGLTYQDAALRLGCPIGTIGVRLRRARERLRARMVRRGLVPTASLLASLLAPEAGAMCPPEVLVDSTVEAAMGFASTPVIALSEKILRVMAFSRFKMAMQLGLAIGISGAAFWLASPQRATVRLAPPGVAAEAGNGGRADENTGIASATPQASTGIASANQDKRTDQAIAGAPKGYNPAELVDLPDDVFARTGSPGDRTADTQRAVEAQTVAAVQEERLRARSGRGVRFSSTKNGCRTMRKATAGTGWGRFTTRLRAWLATGWGGRAGQGRRARTWC